MSRSKRTSGKESNTGSIDDKKRWDGTQRTEDTNQSLISYDLHHPDLHHHISSKSSLPDRNGDRVAGVLSCSNELPNAFLERSRWLDLLYKDILQAGQHFCPNEILESGRDSWHKVLG